MREQHLAHLLLTENLASLKTPPVEYLYKEALTCAEAKEYDQAIIKLLQLLDVRSDYLDGLLLLAAVYFSTGRPELSLARYEAALALSPGNAYIINGIGSCYYTMGEFDKATQCFEQALAIQPDQARFLFNLVYANEGALSAQDEVYIGRLQALHRSSGCTGESRALVCFALARLEERQGDHVTAFRYYDEANRITFSSITYREKDWFDFCDAVEKAFVPALFERLRGAGNGDAAPIFVFGMARSGTSLVEQILASHPDVHGAGEADMIPYIAERTIARMAGQDYPHAVSQLQPAACAPLADFFLQRIRAYYPSPRPRMVVKTVNNFFHAGLIQLLFPRARLIHCVRDPMDNCWSLFKSLFTGNHPYCYDQKALGRYYRRYAQLMAHWHKVLPEPMFDLHYERLIAHPRETIAALLEYCGLPWAEECMDFHCNRRVVMTASARQVHKPLYSASINAWQVAAKELAPLRQALETPL
ncbi:MAG: sulfotransferase [Pseudomonadota bacterium]|nr:sulfotransferase [Pseudomonadota bacterium]